MYTILIYYEDNNLTNPNNALPKCIWVHLQKLYQN